MTANSFWTYASPFIAAGLAFGVAVWIERRKEQRARFAAATVLQAELIRVHRQLKDHGRLLGGYVATMTNRIDANEARKYPVAEIGQGFQIYQSCIKELGLMDGNTAQQVIFCYSNIAAFIQAQSEFLIMLPSIENSNMVGMHAENLSGKEQAAIQHIVRVIPLLSSHAKPLVFTPDAG